MRISLKNLRDRPATWTGPVFNMSHFLVVAGGREIIRVKTWRSSLRHHAIVSLFGVASGYGQQDFSRSGAIYSACEDAGVVFQGEPRDSVKLMLKKLAQSYGYRGKILILEV